MSTLQKYILAAGVGLAALAFSAAAQPAEARHYSGWGFSTHHSRHFVPRHHHWHRPVYPRYYRPHYHYRHRPPAWGYHPAPRRYHYYPHHVPRRSWGFGFHFGH
jgi:hypothetical protein